ncbi:MAG: cobalamin-dependent protein [Actinomycetota bacterium]
MDNKDEILDAIAAAVRRGADDETVSLCEKGLAGGIEPREIVTDGLCRGMHEAGELYESNEFFLPELLIASEAMHAGIQTVTPSLKSAEDAGGGETVVLGVVEGDVHEIGKNLVAVMLEAEGHRVIDMGHDVAPERFLAALNENGARVLALSTMMTTTLPNMRRTVELALALEARPVIIVGGAPLTAAVAEDMGAHGYEKNAARVPGLIKSLLG